MRMIGRTIISLTLFLRNFLYTCIVYSSVYKSLILFSENKNCMLPLFGYFCCRLAVEPECVNSDIYAGIIDINGQKYWARLRNFCIKTWFSRELEDEEKNVIHTIPIDKVSSIVLSNRITYLSISNEIIKYFNFVPIRKLSFSPRNIHLGNF